MDIELGHSVVVEKDENGEPVAMMTHVFPNTIFYVRVLFKFEMKFLVFNVGVVEGISLCLN